ncbi:MAG: hypothetical protein H7337_21845 [Rhizobacter sp.]|nr:hypothetical protein [Rhizobacter sp.]
MKPIHALTPFNIDSISPRLLLCAAAMAVALLALFVDLLHESMARGVQWRETQRISDSLSPTKPASTTVAQLR